MIPWWAVFLRGEEGEVVVVGVGQVPGSALHSSANQKYLWPTNPNLRSSVCQGLPSPEASEQMKFLCRREKTDDALQLEVSWIYLHHNGIGIRTVCYQAVYEITVCLLLPCGRVSKRESKCRPA